MYKFSLKILFSFFFNLKISIPKFVLNSGDVIISLVSHLQRSEFDPQSDKCAEFATHRFKSLCVLEIKLWK